MGSEEVMGSVNGDRVDEQSVVEVRTDQRSEASEIAGLVIEAGNVDASALVGRYVSKETPGVKRPLVGKVASYDHGSGLYTVVYEDGNRENLDRLQVSKILIAEDTRVGSNMKLSCRKRKLDLLVSSGSQDTNVPPPRTRSRKNAPGASDGADTSSHGRTDSDLSDDADSSSNSCDYVQGPSSVASPEIHMLELPPSSGDIPISEESISYLFSVYSFLRSFNIQLFLSPFGIDEFVGSLKCTVQNSLLDAIHLSLMRALRHHLQVLSSEGLELASKCLRYYDWSLLDALTWPAFVVEYLYMMGYMRGLDGKEYGAMLSNGEYYSLPVTIKLKVLQILCDDVMDSAELRTELEMRENLDDDVEDGTDINFPLGDGPRNVHSRSLKNSASRSMCALQDSKEPPKQIPSSKVTESNADVSSADTDGNSDECQLCGMDGTLICCDGCPSAYHSRCIGLNKAFLPDGPWFCPECTINKLGPTSFRVGRSIKGAEALGVDVCGRLFLGTCNYLLVIGTSLNAEPFYRYYNQTDVTKVLSLMSSVAENSSSYAHICNEISKYWEVPASTLEAGQIKPVGENHIYTDRESGADVEAGVRSSVLNSVNQFSFPEQQESGKENCNDATDKTELASHGILLFPSDEQFSSKVISETVQKIFPDTHTRSSKQLGNGSMMTTMSFSNLPYASQRSIVPDISSCASTNEYGMCRAAAGSSYFSNKNDAVGAFGGGRHGSQYSVVQERNDKASNNRVFFNPQSYVNQYIHGDIAASAAANLAILTTEEKRFSDAHISSNSRKTVAASIALQMKAFSRATMYFLWPTYEKKLMDIPRERCGWCIACKGSITSKKGCFLNLAATNAIKGSARNINGLRPTKHEETHFPVIAAHIANMETTLHGLIVGSFLDTQYKLQWRKLVRESSSCRVLKFLLLELEKNIRGIAFSGGWFKLIIDGPSGFSALSGTSRSGPSQKRGPGRRSKKQYASSESAVVSSEDSGKDVQWWRGGKFSEVILQNGTLPSSLVRKAARQGGFRRIPGICYPESVDLPRRSRQLAWRAAVQMCKNASQLALQVRYLDSHIRWRDLVPPEQTSVDGKGLDGDALAFRNAVICDKRVAEHKMMYALTFSNQKHIPLRVMKNVLEKETINNEYSKLWFSENHIPLYLIKEYEEKIGGKPLSGSMTLGSNVQPKFRKKQVKSRRGDIFSYLLHKGDKPSSTSCASCKEDVILRDATTCSICQGKCHKDCAIPLIERKGTNLAYNITCKICYHAKTAALNASRKEILNSQLPLRRQDQLMSGNKFMPQMTAPCSSGSTGKAEVQGTRSSKLEGNNKRRTCLSYGLIWKRKKGDDSGKNFRLENIILKCKEGINPPRNPTCCLCNSPYHSNLMYIRCEKCLNWYHADALELEEAQIFDLVGFKCCRCRRKASPKCPYLKTDSKKLEPEHIDKPNTLEGSMSDLPLLTHSSNPVSHTADGDMVVVNGDPLLHSLGVVEPLPVQTLETGAQSQQKLSVRRPHLLHATDLCFESQSPERNDISHEIDDYDFSMTNDEIFANSSDMVSSYDLQESGGCAAVSVDDADCGYQWPDQMCGSIEDAEYEPQTYFSFTELLASDDDQLHVSDNNMNAVEIGFSSSCGEVRSFEAPAFDGLGSEEVHSTGEELVVKETTFNGVACDICKLAHPSPDLSCEICGQHIHSHCSPWVESEQPSSDANWRCGRCRDWR
ncbi:unnamed protein product [Musa acuminata subsp. burmannicoides]